MIQKDNIVLGAGLVGTLLGILLRKKGHKVDIYEKRSDPRSKELAAGRSINLALSHRGFKALEMAGVKTAIEPLLVRMEGRIVHDMEGNTQVQPYSTENNAIYSVSRGLLNRKLVDEAENIGVNFHFDHYCEEINLNTNALTFDHESDYVKINAGKIFGADGAYSILRREMNKREGYEYQQEYLEYGYKELNILPVHGDFAMEKNGLHIWPRKHFMLIALPNTDKTFTVTLFLPMKGKESFASLEDQSERREFFQKYFPDALKLLPDLDDQWERFPTSTLVTIKTYPWRWGSSFLLIGDAAHAVLPFYGQGMNAGFEDCRILVEMLDASDGNWDNILENFQQQRKKDADALARLAYDNFIEMRDKVADPVFLKMKEIDANLHKKYAEDWIPLYSMVTFSDIPYHVAYERGKIQQALLQQAIEKSLTPDQIIDQYRAQIT